MTFLRLTVLFLFSINVIAFSNDFDDWDFVVDELELVAANQTESLKFSNYWDEHFYGALNGSYSLGLTHQRYLGEFKLGYINRWDLAKLTLEGRYRYSRIIFPSNNDSDTESFYYDRFNLRQGYVEISPIDSVVISAGKQTIVWGQLDIFSPVDFLLPLDFNPNGFSLNKLDNRMPQTTVSLAYYPVEDIEINAYYFPFFEESELFSVLSFDDEYELYDDLNYYWKKVVPSGATADSSAFRVSWYHSLFTAAFTYYNGFNNVLKFRSKLLGYDDSLSDVSVSRRSYSIAYNGFDPRLRFRSKSLGTQTTNDLTTYYQTYYGYFPRQAIGGEISIPLGSVTVKFDATIAEDTYALFPNDSDTLDEIQDHNNGFSDIPVYQRFLALGVDGDFDTWFFNLYAFNLGFFKRSGFDSIWDSYNDYTGENIQLSNFPVLFSANVGRYFSLDKKGLYGLALGFFSQSVGGILYTTHELTESLSFGLMLDVTVGYIDLVFLSDDEVSNDELTDLDDDIHIYLLEPKVTFGIKYSL